MLSRAGLGRMLAPARRPLWGVLLSLAAGCCHGGPLDPEGLAERILPPPGVPAPAAPEAPAPEAKAAAGEKGKAGEGERKPEPAPTAAAGEKRTTGEGERKAGPTPPGADAPPQLLAFDGAPCKPLTLADAVTLAFALQPRLKASLESIEQARGREDIAFAAFLPVLTSAYSVGGFDLNVGGAGFPLPGL